MFEATAKRDGEPVAYVFGPELSADGGAVFVGLFMIRQGVTDKQLDLTNPDTGDRLTVAVPVEGRGLVTDGYAENIRLEVIL